ncbi:MAG: hypothetical protein IKV97_01725 [Clostridia bacterium]|nr:hypothetical protein [Clostridia bacterium]
MLDPKRIVKGVLIFAAAIFTMIYMYHQVIGTKKATLETVNALAITLENSISSTGYIIRDEKVLDTEGAGTVFAVVSDGEKVSGGKTVANIYLNAADAGSKARIDEIDEQLDILKSSIVDQEYFSADMVKLEDDKNEILNSMIHNKAENNYSDCIAQKTSLLISMNKLSTVKSGVSFDAKIEQLRAEKNALSAMPGSTYTRVFAPASGYYYGICDGYEDIFTVESLDKLTIDSFDKMINAQPDEELLTGTAGKIVTKSRWYLMCELKKSESVALSAGNNYSVEFPYSSNITAKMKLDRILSETDKDRVVLIFTTDSMPESFDYTRTQKIKIVSESYSGLKIPKAAMRMLPDGTKGVYVLVGETVHFRRAEDIYQFDDSYIIRHESNTEKQEKATEQTANAALTEESDPENNDTKTYRYLALYDSVIVSGKDLYDGKRIN